MNNTEKKHKVLVIEDSKQWIQLIKLGLNDKVLLVCAYDLVEAAKAFRENSDIAVIATDACVPGDEPNAQFLVQEIRKTFNGPIIAMSSWKPFRKLLIDAGCNHEVETKAQVAAKVLELLGVS